MCVGRCAQTELRCARDTTNNTGQMFQRGRCRTSYDIHMWLASCCVWPYGMCVCAQRSTFWTAECTRKGADNNRKRLQRSLFTQAELVWTHLWKTWGQGLTFTFARVQVRARASERKRSLTKRMPSCPSCPCVRHLCITVQETGLFPWTSKSCGDGHLLPHRNQHLGSYMLVFLV